MALFLFVVYMAVGGLLCCVYVYQASNLRNIEHDYDVLVGVFTGLFFPVIAPISFAVIIAKRMAEK